MGSEAGRLLLVLLLLVLPSLCVATVLLNHWFLHLPAQTCLLLACVTAVVLLVLARFILQLCEWGVRFSSNNNKAFQWIFTGCLLALARQNAPLPTLYILIRVAELHLVFGIHREQSHYVLRWHRQRLLKWSALHSWVVPRLWLSLEVLAVLIWGWVQMIRHCIVPFWLWVTIFRFILKSFFGFHSLYF